MCRWLFAFLIGWAPSGSLAMAGELVDPTRPPDLLPVSVDDPTGSGGAFVLNSLLISPHRRIAIINGTRVKEGDQIGGAEVVEITAGGVLLKAEGNTFEVRMTASVKTAVASGQNPQR